MKQNEPKEASRLIEFLEYSCKLEPQEFAGVLRIFDISLMDKDKKLREFEELLSELIDCYCRLGAKQQKQLIKIIKEAGKK